MIRPIFARRKVNANWRKTLWCSVVKEEYIHELNGCLLFHFGLFSFFSCVCVCVPSSCFCILNKSISMLFENNVEFKFQPHIFRWIFVKCHRNASSNKAYSSGPAHIEMKKKKKWNWRFSSIKWHTISMKRTLPFPQSISVFFWCCYCSMLMFGVHEMCQIKLFQFRFWQMQSGKCIWTC